MSVDDFLPGAWPPSIADDMDKWRQGDLIQGAAGAWMAPGGERDAVLEEDIPGVVGVWTPMTGDVSDTGYLAVTSQTCDIAISGPGQRHPFIQVSPVRNISTVFDTAKIQQAKDGQLVEYVYLTDPPVSGEHWAVDLRISVPASKAILAGVAPVRGFLTDDDELIFSERIAGKMRRPALPDIIARDVVGSVTKLVEVERHKSAWCAELEQIRVEILEGSRLQPQRLRLVAITETKFTPDMCQPLRAEWKTHKRRLKKVGIDQAPLIFRTIDEVKVSLYRNSIPINISALGKGNFL